MKTQVLGLLAAALLASAGAARASLDPQIQAFVDHANAQVQAKVGDCGIDLARGQVKITGYVQSDGRLTGVRIETADGLRASEASVAEALRKVRLDDVPTGLVGAKLTFYVGHAG